jgi:23S rRNA (guanosine2251-2'-O)-methyltransferase
MKKEMQKGKFRDKDMNKNSKGPKSFKENREARFARETRPTREARPAREDAVSSKNIEELPVREDLIEGRNAVIEALKSDRTIEQILIAKGDVEGSVNLIMALARENKVVIKEVDRKKLDQMSVSKVHQGVMAIVTPYKYFQVDDILSYADEKNEKPFIIILDEIEDPHNFGAIIRSAEVCGAHGIIIPKRRNVGVTPVVYKSSAGAVEHMKIAKVTNLNAVIDELKEKGIWVYGADMDGESYCFDVDFKGALALVIGSEGRGISKLTKNKCDVLTKIPMVGNINSLNASVAGGIMMYEVLKQRFKRD